MTAFLVLTACGPAPAGPAPAILEEFPVDPADTPAASLPTNTAAPTPEPTPVPLERPLYTLTVMLDYPAKTVSVDQTTIYPNHNGEPLTNLVLAVVPNLWAGCFNLTALSIDGAPVGNYSLDGQRLEAPLSQPLAPGSMLTISIQYTLTLPFIDQVDPNQERPRIFGYTNRQINLTNWYPFVVPHRPGHGWVLHDPWYYGEHLVYQAADYDLTLTTNPGVVVAASGLAEAAGASTRYTLTAGRMFAISASPEFQTLSTTVRDVTVTSYFFPFYESGGQVVLDTSARAVELYSQRYGPYPHKTLAAVMGDFNDGMEYSAFYFQSRDFYNLYDGSPISYLVFVSAHETAHQWWFETVANDQAEYPWLDESLCTYSERIFYETYYPDQIPNWWYIRIDQYNPQGWVDIQVYEGGGFRPYTNAVYFRGAYFIEEVRLRIGDAAFFAFLQDYRSQLAGKISTPQDFFRILNQHTAADYSDLLAAYFSTPPTP
ncbi:MAG: M1 family metallopeptidase [Anaerolineales bacterium]|nr:M1 family metallopeptidase [Anaerolineales bacterium]